MPPQHCCKCGLQTQWCQEHDANAWGGGAGVSKWKLQLRTCAQSQSVTIALSGSTLPLTEIKMADIDIPLVP